MNWEQLPILQVILPLLSAPCCLLLRRSRWAWGFACLVGCLSFLIAAKQLHVVHNSPTGSISYQLGDWAAPYGIEYRLDRLSGLVLVVVTAIAAVVLSVSRRLLQGEVPEERHHLFFAIFLLCLTGLSGIVSTGDLFNVFVFLEIASLSSYVLISMGRDRRSLLAAFQYLVMGTIGSTFLLIGIGLAYMMTGTLNMADLAERLTMTLGSVYGEGASLEDPALPVNQTRTILAAFGFLTVGLALKLALFPLHAWLPNAYATAPTVVSTFLAGTSTKVAYYVLLRVIFTIFGLTFAFQQVGLQYLLTPLAIMAILIASAIAAYQADLRRLLAYSSVAQIGYLVLGLSFATHAGVSAGIVHLFNHALMKAGLFLVMGCIATRQTGLTLESIRGLGRRMPWTMAAFVVGGLGLIGVPLTSGFVSKWLLVSAALEHDRWLVAVLVLVGSLLAIVYVWRVVEAAYFQSADESDADAEVHEAPVGLLLATWVLLGATLVLGVYTDLTVGVAREAATTLLGGGS